MAKLVGNIIMTGEDAEKHCIEAIGIGISAPSELHPIHPFDSDDLPCPKENWKKFNEYELTQANVRPVEASALELGHEIDRLKKEKNEAIKELNEHMEEYRKLDNDLRDAIREKRRLLDADTMNVLLMKQNLELREQLEWME